MMTAVETPTTRNWEEILSDADLPANELERMLVEVYELPQDEAHNIVERWLYSSCT